jgi:hypothetical protein
VRLEHQISHTRIDEKFFSVDRARHAPPEAQGLEQDIVRGSYETPERVVVVRQPIGRTSDALVQRAGPAHFAAGSKLSATPLIQ